MEGVQSSKGGSQLSNSGNRKQRRNRIRNRKRGFARAAKLTLQSQGPPSGGNVVASGTSSTLMPMARDRQLGNMKQKPIGPGVEKSAGLPSANQNYYSMSNKFSFESDLDSLAQDSVVPADLLLLESSVNRSRHAKSRAVSHPGQAPSRGGALSQDWLTDEDLLNLEFSLDSRMAESPALFSHHAQGSNQGSSQVMGQADLPSSDLLRDQPVLARDARSAAFPQPSLRSHQGGVKDAVFRDHLSNDVLRPGTSLDKSNVKSAPFSQDIELDEFSHEFQVFGNDFPVVSNDSESYVISSQVTPSSLPYSLGGELANYSQLSMPKQGSDKGTSHAQITKTPSIPVFPRVKENAQGSSKSVPCRVQSESLVTPPKAQRKHAKQKCPIDGCNFQTKKVKAHVYSSHLPKYFRPWNPEQLTEWLEVLRLRVKGLQMIAKFLVGEAATLEDLVVHINQHWKAVDPSINTELLKDMYAMIKNEGWKDVPLSLIPIRSPAVLIHFRPLSYLFNQLSKEQQTQLMNVSLVERPPVLPAFDAHFHPDRLRALIGPNADEKAILNPGKTADNAVNIIGGVHNFCDPKEYTNSDFVSKVLDKDASSSRKIAVGIHPKWAESYSDEHWGSLLHCLAHPKVNAISDIGLDYTMPPHQWPCQEALFNRILDLGTDAFVLVMHLKGAKDDPLGWTTHRLGRELIEKKCSKQQRIHIHCFSSDEWHMKLWSVNFSNCYFGLSGMVQYFSAVQLQAVRSIPLDRLLLETNSPHHQVHPEARYNTPIFLGDVGKLVADIRGIPLSELLHATHQNALRLYEDL